MSNKTTSYTIKHPYEHITSKQRVGRIKNHHLRQNKGLRTYQNPTRRDRPKRDDTSVWTRQTKSYTVQNTTKYTQK